MIQVVIPPPFFYVFREKTKKNKNFSQNLWWIQNKIVLL